VSAIITDEMKSRFDAIIKRYPEGQKQAATIPLLHIVQEAEGKLTTAGEQAVADYLGIAVAHVHEVTTFYTMFTHRNRGKKHLMVCRTLSCALMGSDSVCTALRDKLGVDANQVTPDGKVSWETVECLAQCGTGPVIQIDDTVYHNMTAQKAQALIDELKK
jgi:NADH-quinone oxidoreductase subunit E